MCIRDSTLNTSPSAGRVRGLKGSTNLSPVHASHFGLADWVSTPAPRQLSTNIQLDCVVYSRCHVFHGRNQTTKKNPTHLESNPRPSHPKGNSGTPTPYSKLLVVLGFFHFDLRVDFAPPNQPLVVEGRSCHRSRKTPSGTEGTLQVSKAGRRLPKNTGLYYSGVVQYCSEY